jgi:hypothetical protein
MFVVSTLMRFSRSRRAPSTMFSFFERFLMTTSRISSLRTRGRPRAVAVRLLQQVGGVLVHRVVADVAVERDADFLPVYIGELLEPLVAVSDEEQIIREVDVVERVPFGDVLDLGHDARHGLAAQ